MPTLPPEQSQHHRADALVVLRRLREAGHEAYFAGGCVRDELLGRSPKDFDVATDARPPRVRELFAKTQAVGAAFGVILVRQGRSAVEVATFRSDGTYSDGRRPDEVIFTTAQADAQRRDFTINGLFLDPVANRVIDFVGGQADLAAKVVRAIGNPAQRFAEDHLRLVRAVRFASRLGFEIEPGTAAAIAAHAPELPRISPERIAEELRRMLCPPTRVVAWEMLWRFGLTQQILRFLPKAADWPPHSDRYADPLFPAVAPGEAVAFPLALAALVLCYRNSAWERPAVELMRSDAVRAAVQACRKALRISNDESEHLAEVMELAPLLDDNPPTVARIKRFLAKRHAADARRLLEAWRRSDAGLRPRIDWLQGQFGGFAGSEIAPPPLITGDDLTAAGAAPGPAFKVALEAVYDAQLEGRVRDREEAMRMAMGLVRGKGEG